jgi:CotH kinase protein/Chitobiase/beta-hexosaminidase C-terminal domain/Lamin Tail Domain
MIPPAISKYLTVIPAAGWLMITTLTAAPRINEFLASNAGPEVDDQGLTSDWIEIYNPDPVAANLAGWILTDEPDQPAKWIFPSLVLEPDSYLVVRASGLDRKLPGQPLHTNFTLKAGGEYLALLSPAGVPASQWQPYPKQFRDFSYGRAGGGTAVGWLAHPSPGSENDAVVLADYVRDTAFDAPRGFISGPVPVVVTTPTPGATIRYTTNGSEPGETSAPWPATPLIVTTTTVLRVRAFKPGLVPTNVDTRTWILPSTWTNQPVLPAGFPDTWGNALKNGSIDSVVKVGADYEMDPGVTNDPGIIAALTTTLPVLCVTGDVGALFGPSGIMGNGRLGDDEAAVSVEYFNPADPLDRFSARGSIQTHGGGVREYAKKAFRLDFSGALGDGALKYALFPGSETETFDQLVLRSGGQDSFTAPARGTNTLDTNDIPFHASYLRDQFMRRTENRMGLLSPQGRYVHLCLNGLYWGLYDLHERPNARYATAHQGGEEADWDVLHHAQRGSGYQVIDGTADEWQNLLALAASVSTPAEYAALSTSLGPDRFIDHLIARIWAQDFDWLGPATMVNSLGNTTDNIAFYQTKNWYALKRTRGLNPQPWQFFTWDCEISMGSNVLSNWGSSPALPGGLLSIPVPQRRFDFDFTGISRAGTPAQPWAALMAFPEFRLRVADRLRKHFFNGGVLSPAGAQAQLASLIQELDAPMLAESARWGDVTGYSLIVASTSPVSLKRLWKNTRLTRATHWRPEVAWIRDTFAIQRGGVVIDQFKARGIYPLVNPAEITPFGGALASGQTVSLTQPDPASVLYYTTNGTDPRVPVTGAIAPGALIATGPISPPAVSPVILKTRVLKAGEWSALTETVFTTAQPPTAAALAISEIHYHPAAPSAAEIVAGFIDADDFEFLEITNRSANVISLRDLRFALGVDFDFSTGSSLSELAPGARLLLASRAAAFQFRYGFAPHGAFANGTHLANSGEQLKLVTTTGTVIADIKWDDVAPWPLAADGAGRSLTMLAPLSGSDGTTADQWRPGPPTPGTVAASLTFAEWQSDFFDPAELMDPAVSGPGADPDGDGLPNLVEFLTISPPRQANAGPVVVTLPVPGTTRFEWTSRPDAAGFAGTLELAPGLSGWTASHLAPGVVNSTLTTNKSRILHRAETTAPKGFARLAVRAVP